jgi:ribosomal protein L11 methyltransferase
MSALRAEKENFPPLWKAWTTVPKDRAANIAALFELTPPQPQAVLTAEDPFSPDARVEALYDHPPDAAFLTGLTGCAVTAAPLPDQDWVRQSQAGLPPVRAGRFFIYGAHDAGEVPPGVIPIRIEAGLAFGTGHHETTALCLEIFSRLAKQRPYHRALDLGCGSGVLAIAAAKLWHCVVLATDIDKIAVDVTRENARSNEVRPFIRSAVANGLTHPMVRSVAPFDLIVANILAAPLTRVAASLSASLLTGGVAVLSGILRNQEGLVLGVYRAHGLVLRRIYHNGPWSALVLQRLQR